MTALTLHTSKTEETTAAVAALVRQGLSNRQIAQELGMKYNSVKASVYRAGLRSNPAPRDNMPKCQGCPAMVRCMASVIRGGHFARLQCNQPADLVLPGLQP